MQNQANKMIGQRKPGRNAPKSYSNYYYGRTLSLSLPVCLPKHALFPPNKQLTCFTAFCLCGNSFSAKAKSQGLVTDHWSSG